MPLDAQERGLLDAIALTLLREQVAQLRTALARAVSRAEKRRIAIVADIARARDVETIRLHGSMLLAHLHAVKRGAASFTYETGVNDTPVTIDLDPSKSATQNAERFFTQARKLETGARIAKERLSMTDHELTRLRSLLVDLDTVTEAGAIEPIVIEARKLKVPVEATSPGTKPAKKIVGRVPFRLFHSSEERRILVGKGAADNDALTLHHAKPQDLWLHARDRTGAHVVVPLSKGESCPSALLVDAATLAAHFSDARGEDRVDVQYTHKRFVRKPKGSAKGAVEVTREKVLVVRMEEARLKRLLSSEGIA